MYFTAIVIGLALAGRAFAQYGAVAGGASAAPSVTPAAGSAGLATASGTPPTASSSSSASSGGVSVHVVKVSNKNKELVFSPADIKAAAGDMVQFQFYPMNHSVVQSTFDQPCQPIANNMPGAQGFFSGFMPVMASASQMPAYSIAINDTKPIWFYCSQGKHCQSGMVGVINAPAANQSRTLDSFTTLAKSAPKNVSPGVVEGGTSTNSSSSSSSSSSSGNSTSTGAAGTSAGGGSAPAASASSSPTGFVSAATVTAGSGVAPVVYGALMVLGMFVSA